MAGASAAVELPTSRQSSYFNSHSPNVHDPNYIPVLNGGAELKVDFSQPSFSAIPSIPKPHVNAVQTSLKRSKSGSAPETVVYSRGPHLHPSRLHTQSRNAVPQELGSPHSPIVSHDPASSASDDNATSTSDGSTGGLDNVFVIPGNSTPTLQGAQRPPAAHSARSSISSAKKANVPTSRFNQKNSPLPALPPKALPAPPQSPLSSRVASPDTNQSQRRSPELPGSGASTPAISTRIEEPPKAYHTSSPRLPTTKATASDKKLKTPTRSHFSGVSVKTTETSMLDETDEIPLIPHITVPEVRRSSSRSRGTSICSQQPTPAPNTPLPDLPPSIKTPSTREKPSFMEKSPLTPDTPASFLAPIVASTQPEHVEMAEFMTSKKMMIFRRFDDVHVRLLLYLQDEISALEKELSDLEEAGPAQPDIITRKANVMRELRKALAEYDHLFANWSSMQANKASDQAKEHLAQWLQKPGADYGEISRGARADLDWLQSSKDLSSVSIETEKPSKQSTSTHSSSWVGHKTNEVGGGGGSGGGGGGGGAAAFLGLFGCASKRK